MKQHILLLLLCLSLAACGGPEQKLVKFLNKGDEHFSAGNYVAARLDYKNVLQINPKHSQAYFKLAETEAKLKNFQAAYKLYSRAVHYDPENLKAHLAQGNLLLAARQYEQAGEKADQVLNKDRDNAEAKVLKAAVLLSEKKASDAIELLKDLVTPNQKLASAFSTLAIAYFQEDQEVKGKEIVEAGLKNNPDSVALYLIMAGFKAKRNDIEGAAEQLQNAISLQPDNPKLTLQLVELYWKGGQQDKAREIIQTLLSKEADNEPAYLFGASFYLLKKETGEAEDLLRQGLQEHPQSFKLRFALCDIMINQRKYTEALALLDECLALSEDESDPNIIQTKVLLAKIHLAKEETAKANTYVDEVFENNPKSIEGHYIKGKILLTQGLNEEATAKFRVVVDEKPLFIPGYLLLAQSHNADKKTDLAMEVLTSGLDTVPGSPELLIAMARLQAQGKEYEAAEKTLRKILQDKPNDARTLLELGTLFAISGKYEKAEEEFLKIVIDHPKHPAGYLKLGQLMAVQKDWSAAAEALEKGQENIANPAQLLDSLVRVYLADNKIKLAIAACEEEIKRSPKSPVGYTMLGKVHAAAKHYPDAEKVLQKAIQLSPTWQTPYTMLAAVQLAQGKEQEAIAELTALQQADPSNKTTYFSLGAIYEKKGDNDLARKVYRQLLDIHPDSWVAANNLAYRITEDIADPKHLDEALQLVETALMLRPGQPMILDTLGWVHYRRGDLGKATARLDQALEKAPDNPVLNYHAAVVLKESDRKDEAREKVKKALLTDEEFPGREDAERLLKEML